MKEKKEIRKWQKVNVDSEFYFRHVHGQKRGRRPFTFMGMLVMVVEAKSKCCWTRMLSLLARWRPARTLWTSLVSRGEI